MLSTKKIKFIKLVLSRLMISTLIVYLFISLVNYTFDIFEWNAMSLVGWILWSIVISLWVHAVIEISKELIAKFFEYWKSLN
jgi:hypothetical protein